jgi:starvation-inducible outer membrane lipoprotein
MLHKIQLLLVFFAFMIIACESKPKVIVADENTAITTPNNQSESPIDNKGQEAINTGNNAGVHQVVANEILQSERYTYLQVNESGHNFWIATSKTEAKKGETYLYKGGLMKTNFESVEFKRVFDTIYLVSNIISAAAHPGGNMPPSMSANGDQTKGTKSDPKASENLVKDAIKLSDLMDNKSKYDGKIITISGECVKVNNGIMGRNWVHIQDGSKTKGKMIDLTVTTKLNIPLGSQVALKGKISLNKDFGAGYRYDVMMEDAGEM